MCSVGRAAVLAVHVLLVVVHQLQVMSSTCSARTVSRFRTHVEYFQGPPEKGAQGTLAQGTCGALPYLQTTPAYAGQTHCCTQHHHHHLLIKLAQQGVSHTYSSTRTPANGGSTHSAPNSWILITAQ